MIKLSSKSKKKVIISAIIGAFTALSVFVTTFAYFNSDIVKNGVSVNSQKIDIDFYGFKATDSSLVSKFHYESGEVTNSSTIANEKLDDIYTLSKRAPIDYYFVVKKNIASMDLDTRISFEITGINDGSTTNEQVLSSYNFQYEKLNGASVFSNPDNLASDTSIRNTVFNYSRNSGDNTGETDILSHLNDCSWLANDLRTGNVILYRLTVELDENAVLTGTEDFGINAKLSVGRQGSISGGSTYYIYSYEDLTSILNTYESGSNIYFPEGLYSNGDIVFPRPCNIYVRSYEFDVYGNVIFSTTEEGEFLIDCQLGGRFLIFKSNNVGGNLIFDTPNASVTITGSNGKGQSYGYADFYIEGNAIFDCKYTNGVTIDEPLMYKYNGSYEVYPNGTYVDLCLKDSTSITIEENTTVGTIKNYSNNDKRISITNNGEIQKIDVSTMKQKTDAINEPQIVIDNYVTIDKIILPTWANKFDNSASTVQKTDSNGQPIYNVPVYVKHETLDYYYQKEVDSVPMMTQAVFTDADGELLRAEDRFDSNSNNVYYCVSPNTDLTVYFYVIVDGVNKIVDQEISRIMHFALTDSESNQLVLTKEAATISLAGGNTQIIHEYGSCSLRSLTDEIISGSDTFVCRDDSHDDVSYKLLTDYVILTARDGNNISIRVLYENRTDSFANPIDLGPNGTTLQILVEDYLTNHTLGLTTANIVGLSVKCYVSKSLTADDYTFIRSLTNLTTLDLKDAKSVNYLTPDYAFQNMSNLIDLKMPSDTDLGNYLFDGTGMEEVRMAASVERVSVHSFDGVKYLHQEGYNIITQNLSVKNLYLFVPDRNVFNEYDWNGYVDNWDYNHLFIEAEHCGNYFLRLNGDYCEFACYVGDSTHTKFNYNYEFNGPNHFNFDTIQVGEKTYIITEYDTYSFWNMIDDTTDPIDISFEADRQLTISNYAFYETKGIRSISFGCPVVVGEEAFWDCVDLESLEFLEECDLGYYAFDYDRNLTSLSFEKYANIQNYAFYYADKLTEITLGDCNIGPYAFYNCLELQSITCTGDFGVGNNAFYISVSGKKSKLKYVNQTDPESTITIADNAFNNCISLYSLNLQGSGTVGTNFINNCSGLFELILPKVTTLTGDTGSTLSNLRYIYMPSLCYLKNSAKFNGLPNCYFEMGVPIEHSGQRIINSSASVVVFNPTTSEASDQSQVIIPGFYDSVVHEYSTNWVKYITSAKATAFSSIVKAYCSTSVHTLVDPEDYVFYTPEGQENFYFSYTNTAYNEEFKYYLPGNYIYYLTGEVGDDGVAKADFVCDLYTYICGNPASPISCGIGDYIYNSNGDIIAKITKLLAFSYCGSNYAGSRNNFKIELPASLEVIEMNACCQNRCFCKLDLPNLKSVGVWAFFNSIYIKYVNAPKLEIIESSSFRTLSSLLYFYAPSLNYATGSCCLYDCPKLRVVEIGIPISFGGFTNQDKTGVGGIQYVIIHAETYEGDISDVTLSFTSSYLGRFLIMDETLYPKLHAYVNSASRDVGIYGTTTDLIYQGKTPDCTDATDCMNLTYYDYETNQDITLFDAEYLCYFVEEAGVTGVCILPRAVDTILDEEFTMPTELVVNGVTYPVFAASAGVYSRTTFANTTLTVPSCYKEIGPGCFVGTTCKGLDKVIFEGDIKLGYATFHGNNVISEIEFQGDVEGVNLTFYNATYLNTITFAGDASFTGGSNFYGCISLANLNMGGKLEFNTVDTTSSNAGNNFNGCKALLGNANGELILDNDITLIKNDFANFSTHVNTLKINGNLTTTGAPFDANGKIKYLIIEGDVNIVASSFANLKQLTYVEVGGEGNINGSVFSGCSELKVFYGPKVTKFSTFTFQSCSQLEYVYAPCCIQYGYSSSTFSGCTNLKVVELGPQSTDLYFPFINLKKLRLVFIHTENIDSDFQVLPTLDVPNTLAAQLSDNCTFFIDENNATLYDLYYRVLGSKYLSSTYELTADKYIPLILDNTIEDKGFNIGYTDNQENFVSVFKCQAVVAYDKVNAEAYNLYYSLDIGEEGVTSDVSVFDEVIINDEGTPTNVTVTKHLASSFRDATVYSSNLTFENANFIGNNAFLNKTNILSTTFNVDTYIFGGFIGCSGITAIHALHDITLTDYAYSLCTSLTDLDFAEDVSLLKYAFNGCSSITEFISTNPDATFRDERYCWVGTNIEKIKVLGNASFGSYCCYQNATLKYLEVYKNFETEGYCFYQTKLVYAYLPEATYFSDYLFYECKSLEYLYAPMVTKLGVQTMQTLSAAQTIELGYILENNGAAFNYCYAANLIIHSESVDASQYGTYPGNNLATSNNNIYTKLIVDENLYPYYAARGYSSAIFNVYNTGSVHSEDYLRADDPQLGGKYYDLDNEIGYQYLYYINDANEAILLSILHFKTITLTTYDLPSTLGGAPLVELSAYLFCNKNLSVTNFNVPDSVRKFGDSCFSAGGGQGTSKTMTNFNAHGVEYVATYCFNKCKVTNYDLYNVVEFGTYALTASNLFSEIHFGPNIRKFGANTFNGCSALKKVYFETHDCSVASRINGDIGSGFPGAANVYVHMDVKKALYSSTVANLAAARYLTFDITYQASSTAPKYYLSAIYEDDGVTFKGYQLISFDLNGNTNIVIPSIVSPTGEPSGKILTFTNYTLMNLTTSVTSLTLPQYLESFSFNRSYNPTSLTQVLVDTTDETFDPNYTSVDGVLYNKDCTTLIWYPKGKTGIEFHVPNTVQTIGYAAFSGSTRLTTIYVPSSVTYCAAYAFQSIPVLQNVIFDGAPLIDTNCFASDSKLVNVIFDYDPSYLDVATFTGSDNFTSSNGSYRIYIPETLLESYKSRLSYDNSVVSHLYTFATISITINTTTGAGTVTRTNS